MPGSPSARTRLEYGDKILSINVKNSQGYSLSQIKSFFLREGVPIHMVIERKGEKSKKNLSLKNIFNYPPFRQVSAPAYPLATLHLCRCFHP
jgi:C-terminal processing protease CtpA/Prc